MVGWGSDGCSEATIALSTGGGGGGSLGSAGRLPNESSEVPNPD